MARSDDEYPPDETVHRRDEVIKRMLNTLPQPRKKKPKERPAQKGRP